MSVRVSTFAPRLTLDLNLQQEGDEELLELKNVNTSYDFLQILWDLSLLRGRGRVRGAGGTKWCAAKPRRYGPSAGLLTPYERRDPIQGQRASAGLKAHTVSRMGISYISEGLNLFTDMSVRENLLLGAYAAQR